MPGLLPGKRDWPTYIQPYTARSWDNPEETARPNNRHVDRGVSPLHHRQAHRWHDVGELFGSAWNLGYVTSISQRDADGVDPTIDEKLARFHHANARPLPYVECLKKTLREKIALRLAPPPIPMLTDEELAELLAAFDIEL